MSLTIEARMDLTGVLEHLGLRQAAAVLPGWLERAAHQELSHAEFLHSLLEEEAAARANAATARRLRTPTSHSRPPSSNLTSASARS
jgi:hypothetical protein